MGFPSPYPHILTRPSVPGMKVLELGCGFGALADLMATEYGVEVTGVTLSEETGKGAGLGVI